MSNNFSFLRFLSHFLFILAAWTLVIKFIIPVCFALKEGEPLSRYILWDFWWVIHIALGLSLLHFISWIFWFGLVTSIVEIVIIVTKFYYFFEAPEWSIWKMNWFVNKIFVLACFVLMLGYLITHKNLSQKEESYAK